MIPPAVPGHHIRDALPIDAFLQGCLRISGVLSYMRSASDSWDAANDGRWPGTGLPCLAPKGWWMPRCALLLPVFAMFPPCLRRTPGTGLAHIWGTSIACWEHSVRLKGFSKAKTVNDAGFSPPERPTSSVFQKKKYDFRILKDNQGWFFLRSADIPV